MRRVRQSHGETVVDTAPHDRSAHSFQLISLLAEHRLRDIESKEARHHLGWLAETASTLYLLQQRAARPGRDGASLQAYLRDTAEYWNRALHDRGIRVTIEAADHLHLSESAMITLAILAHEETAYSIEHSFPDGRPGTIAIRLAPLGHGRAELTVSDDGRQPAATGAQGPGVALVQQLAEASGWQYECSTDGHGRRIAIRFRTGAPARYVLSARLPVAKVRRSPKVGSVARHAMKAIGTRARGHAAAMAGGGR